MKTTRLLLTGIVATLACSMTTYAQGDGPGKGDKKGAHRGGGPGHAEMIKKFDKDGDGKLSEDERKEMKAAMQKHRAATKAKMLERFDADNDGKLSEEERKTARETLKAEREEIRAAVLKQFDANGNGKLDEDERKGVREWVKKIYPDAIHMPHRGGKGDHKGRHGKGGKKGRGGKGGPPAGE